MFTTSKAIISQALNLVNSSVATHDPNPILASLLLEGDENGMWISGTNAQVTVMARVEGEYSEFSICLPSAQFSHLVPLFGSDFTVDCDGKWVMIKHGKARHKLPCYDTALFPETPTIEGTGMIIKAALLKRMLAATTFAIDRKSDGKYSSMQGLSVCAEGGELTLVGCDGARLAAASTLAEGEINVVLPLKGAEVFAKFADAPGNVEIIAMENHLALRSERGVVFSRLLTGKYPDWRMAVPKNNIYKAEINVPDFLLAMKRVSFAAPQRDSMEAPALTFKATVTKDELKLESRSAEKGEGKEFVDITCAAMKNGDEKIMGMAGRQVTEFLNQIESGIVNFEFGVSEGSALLFSPKRDIGFVYSYMTMPVRVKW